MPDRSHRPRRRRRLAGLDLERARSGDREATRFIWDRYAGEITGFLSARGTPDVGEVVNDTFVAVFSSLDGFEGDDVQFRAWIYRIARNKRVDALRRRAVQPIPTPGTDDLDGGDTEAEAVARLADADLRSMLEGLTADQRDVVVLRFVSDLSLEQTAAAIDKPVGAVKALQHRALEQLRKRISPNPYPDDLPGSMS